LVTKLKKTKKVEADEVAQAEFKRKIDQIDPKKLVYIDETGFNEWFGRTRCWAKRGTQIFGKVSGKKFQRTNLVAGLLNGKIVGAEFYNCNMTSNFFASWFEKVLLKSVPQKRIIVMDNAAFHPKKLLRKLAKQHKCQLIFLPPYSPQLNPIEKCWGNVKRYLRSYVFKKLIPAICGYFKIG